MIEIKHLMAAFVAPIALLLSLNLSWAPPVRQAIDQQFSIKSLDQQRAVGAWMDSDPVSTAHAKGVSPLHIGVGPVPIEVSVEGGQVIAREDDTFVVTSSEGLRVYRAQMASSPQEISVGRGQVILREDGSITILNPGQPQQELDRDAAVDILVSDGEVVIQGLQQQVIVHRDGTITVIDTADRS